MSVAKVRERLAALEGRAASRAAEKRAARDEQARRNRAKYPEIADFVDSVRAKDRAAKVIHFAPTQVPAALGQAVKCNDCVRFILHDRAKSPTERRCALDPDFKRKGDLARRCDDYTPREKPRPVSGGSREVCNPSPRGTVALNKTGRAAHVLNNPAIRLDSNDDAPGAPDHARTADLFGPTVPRGR